MVLYDFMSRELTRVRVNAICECPERNQRFCRETGRVKSRQEELQNGQVCKIKAARGSVEEVDLQNERFASTKH